jgi:hypothetical protein
MPFPIEKDTIAIMESNGVQAQWATYAGNPGDADVTKRAARTVCSLLDVVSGEKVAEATGEGRIHSLKLATDILRAKPRVMAKDQVADLQTELAILKAKLAEVKDTPVGKNARN